MRRSRLSQWAHFLRSYFSREPSYLIFFITAVCNARCRHCFYWQEIDSAKASQELGLPEIEKIARSLPRLIYLSVGGGEPFLRKDLPEVVGAFYQYSGILYANIVTNGSCTESTVAAIRKILETCPSLRLRVQVSIDDFESAHDENRRVPGIYRKALETLRRLSVEFRSREPRFSLDIATCLTRTNKEHASALSAHLRREVEFDNFAFLYPRGNAQVPGEKEVSAAEYAAAVSRLEQDDLGRTHNPILGAVHRVAREGILRIVERNEHPWYCLAGRKFLNLTERGLLQPCEVLAQMRPDYDSGMGDLRRWDFDVRRALADPKVQDVVRWIRETRCRCSFECAAMNNVVFDHPHALRVIWTWMTGAFRFRRRDG